MKFPWKRPKCARCGTPIETPDDAMAQWRRGTDPDRPSLDMPVINCKSGGCAAVFWTALARDGMMTQDLPIKWLRAAPVEAIGIAMDAVRLGQPEEPWLRWLVEILGLPLTTVEDAMMGRD